jgi:hypothetical protein
VLQPAFKSRQLYVGSEAHSRSLAAELSQNGEILRFAARLLRLGCMQWNSENRLGQQGAQVKKEIPPTPALPCAAHPRHAQGAAHPRHPA